MRVLTPNLNIRHPFVVPGTAPGFGTDLRFRPCRRAMERKPYAASVRDAKLHGARNPCQPGQLQPPLRRVESGRDALPSVSCSLPHMRARQPKKCACALYRRWACVRIPCGGGARIGLITGMGNSLARRQMWPGRRDLPAGCPVAYLLNGRVPTRASWAASRGQSCPLKTGYGTTLTILSSARLGDCCKWTPPTG